MSDSNTSPKVHNVDEKLRHLFEGSSYNVYDSNVVNLSVGAPGTDLLSNCCEIFKKATDHRMQYEQDHNNSYLFQYGPTTGIHDARNVIAKYFGKVYGSDMKSEDLFLTAGATQGLHAILSTLVDFKGFVFVDEVTYMIALDVIKQFETLTIVPVKLNETGVDLKSLEQAFKKHKFTSKSKEFWGMYYTIPVYHNPTGIVFSEEVCKGIVELARTYDVLVTCDDVYNILHYDNESIAQKRLFAYDDCSDAAYRGHVISNCSFSKIIAPGLRLGWMEAPARAKRLLETSGLVRSGGCFNNYMAGIVASLFELGLAQEHISMMFAAYKERMIATCEVLRANLPEECRMLTPSGGYFIWIRLPPGTDVIDFLKFCLNAETKLFFLAGSIFSLTGEANDCARLAIAFHSTEKLRKAALLFCSLLKEYLNKMK